MAIAPPSLPERCTLRTFASGDQELVKEREGRVLTIRTRGINVSFWGPSWVTPVYDSQPRVLINPQVDIYGFPATMAEGRKEWEVLLGSIDFSTFTTNDLSDHG